MYKIGPIIFDQSRPTELHVYAIRGDIGTVTYSNHINQQCGADISIHLIKSSLITINPVNICHWNGNILSHCDGRLTSKLTNPNDIWQLLELEYLKFVWNVHLIAQTLTIASSSLSLKKSQNLLTPAHTQNPKNLPNQNPHHLPKNLSNVDQQKTNMRIIEIYSCHQCPFMKFEGFSPACSKMQMKKLEQKEYMNSVDKNCPLPSKD